MKEKPVRPEPKPAGPAVELRSGGVAAVLAPALAVADAALRSSSRCRQHFLYFLPLPHRQGALRLEGIVRGHTPRCRAAWNVGGSRPHDHAPTPARLRTQPAVLLRQRQEVQELLPPGGGASRKWRGRTVGPRGSAGARCHALGPEEVRTRVDGRHPRGGGALCFAPQPLRHFLRAARGSYEGKPASAWFQDAHPHLTAIEREFLASLRARGPRSGRSRNWPARARCWSIASRAGSAG